MDVPSVARNGGVDGAGPLVDATGERLDRFEALVAHPHGDGERTRAVMADDDVGLVGVKFGVGAGGELGHGDEGCAGDGGSFGFPLFADVEQGGGVGAVCTQLGVSFGGNFRIEHRYRINGLGCVSTSHSLPINSQTIDAGYVDENG